MKNLTNLMKRTALYLFMAIILTGFVNAQSTFNTSNPKYKCGIGNIKSGFESENKGLRKSCIYYAGYYKVEAVVPELVTMLKSSKDPGETVLIALALYNIGNEEGIEAIMDMAANSEDGYAKRILTAICRQYSELTGADYAGSN